MSPVTRGLSLAMALAAWPVLVAADTRAPEIAHEPLRCVRAREFPRVGASVTSASELKRTRVYFKAHQHPDWYYVDMRVAEGPHAYLALLPQPLPETRQVDYYVQALDSSVQSTQTDTYEPEVNRDRCRLPKTPAWRWPARIRVGGTKENQSPIPPGFNKKGIVAFVAASGVVATGAGLAGGGSGAGGGISTTQLIVGGGGVAAASAGVIALAGGSAPEISISVNSPAALVGFTRVMGTASVTGITGGLFEWDFGDGERATGAAVEHVYQATGVFTIAVKASGSSGGSSRATSTIRVGSLTGLWHSEFGFDGTGSSWRCVQNAGRFDCQSNIDKLTTAVGSLRQPLSIDLEYRYLEEYHAFPYNMRDYRCSGEVRADLNRFECVGGNAYAQGNYGMDRVME